MKKLPRSVKKFLRREKARLRRALQEPRQLEQALAELRSRFHGRQSDQKD